ncbi:putative manganese-dependent inorganic diphosphatase [Methanoculleus sp. FWC-SCC1]|uniref:inorganic diphosphatase n=1 Tax=Methanoculleus frigidifontis TaxID=2584085 RepID=A0ABT8MB51_9EURY|nr:putative manganese-dependent inorganic diphosphatase [Methanoculleus sp. FWC-SCC1]MDN7025115.1 putative manganese-dependent inorganic diphosphatase [Methanoculleus sp. FWC-SCC1]
MRLTKIYIIGHKQPDTDSICSVIGYAELLNQTGTGTYVPARCGEVNAETQFALATFGAEPPLYIASIEPTVSDMPLDSRSARQDVPTIDVAAMMDTYDMRNVPITDEAGVLLGLVSEYGLARSYVRKNTGEQLSLVPMKLETLARILDGRIVTADRETIGGGRVYTVIDALHVTLSRMTPNDIAIVGDNEPAQLALISAGIAAMIIAEGAPAGERVIKAAEGRGVSMLATTLDAFSVGKMISLSLPAHLIMEKTDLPIVRMEDSLEYAKEIVSTSKFRTACAVGPDGRHIGLVSRTTLMQSVQKSVILLDHNEYSQAVDGIESADILEIVDHHRLGAISTLKPVKFLNEPVGSTSTIITNKFIEADLEPSASTAGLLLSGILSDTMVMKLSTTTPADTKAAGYLAGLTGYDPVAYGTELIGKGMELGSLSPEELLTRDMKRYNLFGKTVMIAQVMVSTFDYSESHANEVLQTLERLRASTGVDCFIALFTNVFANASDLFAAGEDTCLKRLDLQDQPHRLEGVMSRKKDFLPQFGQMFKNA